MSQNSPPSRTRTMWSTTLAGSMRWFAWQLAHNGESRRTNSRSRFQRAELYRLSFAWGDRVPPAPPPPECSGDDGDGLATHGGRCGFQLNLGIAPQMYGLAFVCGPLFTWCEIVTGCDPPPQHGPPYI